MSKKILLLLAATSATVYAQTVPTPTPDAGTLQQQIDQQRSRVLPRTLPSALPQPAEKHKAPTGVTVVASKFKFIGATRLSTDLLEQALSKYIGQTLGFTELEAAASDVAKIYRDAGWLVKTFLPAQDIANGLITIQIVESTFGTIKLETQAETRTPPERVLKLFENQQKSGQALNADALDRALLLAADLPGIAVRGSLQEGKTEGQTDLLLNLSDAVRLTGDASTDNTGSRSTGAVRAGANVSLNSALGWAEQFSLGALVTEGSAYARMGATLPVGADGWRVGANASHLQYKLVGSDFSALDAQGTSDTLGLEASYPLVRSRKSNLFLNVTYDQKKFDNQATGATTSHYQVSPFQLGLSGNLLDTWNGANSASLSFVHGKVSLADSPNELSDSLTAHTAGSYSKLKFAANRQQTLTNSLALYLSASGQFAQNNLDSSEKFYLGGSSGVRAYASSEGGGSDGVMGNVELRWRANDTLSLVGFYDAGQVRVNHDNNFYGAAAPNNITLRGMGFSAIWQPMDRLSIKGTWAHRLGSNPNPTEAGNDQDGTLVLNRFWMNALLAF